MKSSLKKHFNPLIGLFIFTVCFCTTLHSKAAERYYYQIKVYHFKTTAQEARLDQYLQTAYIPAMHKIGIKNIGVFKPIDVDTADRKIYVWIPFRNWDELENADQKIAKDAKFMTDGKDYWDALYNNVPYTRIETMVLKSFADSPVPVMPNLTANRADRVYELRSYENPTEKYHASKLKMFTVGGELGLFTKINANAVFYAEVLAGSRMPNLMYLTTYNNKQDRDEHWKAFFGSPEWKTLSAQAEYQKNVSKNDDQLLHPTDYSDF
jgi:hypothetical protein